MLIHWVVCVCEGVHACLCAHACAYEVSSLVGNWPISFKIKNIHIFYSANLHQGISPIALFKKRYQCASVFIATSRTQPKYSSIKATDKIMLPTHGRIKSPFKR